MKKLLIITAGILLVWCSPKSDYQVELKPTHYEVTDERGNVTRVEFNELEKFFSDDNM